MKKMKEGLRQSAALVLAFLVGFAPTYVYAADAHVFRDPATLAPTGASVSDAGVYSGDGSGLSNITAATASALAANPADCAANQFANTIAANGDLTCAAITDADVPNSITIDAATALAANPADCSANQFANAIAANGDLTCAALADADIPDSITVSNYLLLTGGTLSGSLTLNDNDTVSGDVNIVLGDADETGNILGAANIYDDAAGTSPYLELSSCGTSATVTSVDAAGTLTCSSISITESQISDLTHTTDTNANTICAGTDTYLDGEGNCDDLSAVYQPLDADLTSLASHYQGKDTKANICSTTPGAAGNFMTSSDAPFQIYTATAAVVGSWVGQLNGIGACE